MEPQPPKPPDGELAALMRARRTIHNFQADPPPRSLLLEAIELARWAPNHHRTEPWEFLLIGPRTANAIIDLNCELVAEAKGPQAAESKRKRWARMPGWFGLSCLRSEDPLREREDYAACCCAVQNLSLYLWAQGVGVKWTTGPVTRDPRLCERLGIPPTERFVVGLFWYGYPQEIPRQTRRDVGEIVRECD